MLFSFSDGGLVYFQLAQVSFTSSLYYVQGVWDGALAEGYKDE